jgi:multidrug efflux pump subunit AcrA (membrane-fusion protein)
MSAKRAIPWGVAVAGLALAGLVAATLVPANRSQAQAPKGKGGPPGGLSKVLVAAVREAAVADERSFVGTVKPIRRSLVGSAAAGRVEQYLINEGEPVAAGQPIAILRRGIIQAELDAAKGTLAMHQAELAELEKSLKDEIEQAEAKLANAEAQFAFRQGKVDRSKALGTSIAREILEEDTTLAIQAGAALREARAALRMLTEGPREQKTLQAEARVEAQAAEVQRLAEQFDRHTMFAPFDGFVTAEHTEIGQWVMQGDPVAEIIELKEVDVEIAVLEDYVAGLDTSVVGEVEIAALGGQTFPGRVAVVNPQADARAHTFPVKVRVENQFVNNQPLIKAGMFARVKLPVGKPVTRTLVPKDAVVLGGPSPMIYVAAGPPEKAVVRPVPVKLGTAAGTWIAVTGEVQPGDAVIVEGNERVRPGMEIVTQLKELAGP